MKIGDELARCDREIAEILSRPDVTSGIAPAYLVTLGIEDWLAEKRLIMKGGTPFEEDCAVLEMASLFGLQVSRYTDIEITDMKAIKENGLTKESPDYAKIRKLL